MARKEVLVTDFVKSAKVGDRFVFLSSSDPYIVERVGEDEGKKYVMAHEDENRWHHVVEGGKVIFSWLFLWEKPTEGFSKKIVRISRRGA